MISDSARRDNEMDQRKSEIESEIVDCENERLEAEREKREVEQETGEQLISAATKGNLRECEDIFTFAEEENLDILNIRILGRPGADPSKHWTDNSALMCACRSGHAEVAKMLLEKGANVELFDRDEKRTALMLAAMGNHLEILALLRGKADHSATDIHGKTALIIATIDGLLQAVEQLLWDSEVNAVDDHLRSSLAYAAIHGHFVIAKKLCDFAADIDACDKTKRSPLMHAARWGYDKIVKLLIDRGADINLRDKMGWTALMLAVRWGKIHSVEILLSAGADISIRERNTGQNAFMLAASKTRNLELIKLLISFDTSVDYTEKDIYGKTVKDHVVGVEMENLINDAISTQVERREQAEREAQQSLED